MTLSKQEEHAIRSSFNVMDDEKMGIICVRRVQTIWLGLGYGKISLEELNSMMSGDEWTINAVVEILSRQPSPPRASSYLVETPMTAHDLIELAQVAGDTLTLEEADAMMDGKESWSEADIMVLLTGETLPGI